MNGTVDLHVHTTASDGTDSPAWVIALAHALGLAAVAITDHDTVAALPEAMEAGPQLGVEVVPGIELSADYRGREVHILGYFIDYTDPDLQEVLAQAVRSRVRRNEAILQALDADSMHISPADMPVAPGAVPGRPHIAQALVHLGYADDLKDAFDRYIGLGKPYYRPRKLMGLGQAVSAIRQAGGVASLAHPMKYGFDRAGREALVQAAREVGCAALEAYYAEHTPSQQAELVKLAAQYGLALSGGSDYHGARRPRTQLGTGIGGSLAVPCRILDGLKALRP